MDPVALNKAFHDHECAYYDQRFAIVHDESSARRAREELEALLERPVRPHEVVLDVGCGTGWFAVGLQRACPDAVVIGLDLSTGMLGRAAAAGAPRLVQADAGKLPLPDGVIDIVVGRGVLHHMPDPEAALREWHRVVKPYGAVVLASEPTPVVERHGAWLLAVLLKLPGLHGGLSHEDEFWELAAMAANLHTFTASELRELAAAAGYGDVRVRATGCLETLIMTASYAIHGHSPGMATRIPWRRLTEAGARIDRLWFDRVLPERWRHTLAGRLKP